MHDSLLRNKSKNNRTLRSFARECRSFGTTTLVVGIAKRVVFNATLLVLPFLKRWRKKKEKIIWLLVVIPHLMRHPDSRFRGNDVYCHSGRRAGIQSTHSLIKALPSKAYRNSSLIAIHSSLICAARYGSWGAIRRLHRRRRAPAAIALGGFGRRRLLGRVGIFVLLFRKCKKLVGKSFDLWCKVG